MKNLFKTLTLIGCIALPLAARANDEGISSRFYCFTNANLGPALGAGSNLYSIVDTGSFSNMTTGIFSNWFEYSIDKGRGCSLFQTVGGTNASSTNYITNIFDFSWCGSSAKTSTILGSNQNLLPYGLSSLSNYTSGYIAGEAINWFYQGAGNANMLGLLPDGALIWIVPGPGNNTNTYSISIPPQLMDNYRWMRWTGLSAATNGNLTAPDYLTVSAPVISEFP